MKMILILCAVLVAGIFTACETAQSDNGPATPSRSNAGSNPGMEKKTSEGATTSAMRN